MSSASITRGCAGADRRLVGVRNYQARNFMRDEMKPGDRAFLFHSSCPQPGIAGIIEVVRTAYPDATQFDRKSEYYDPKGHGDSRAGSMSTSPG
jgi:predicted RNA-binding protein with PUA-like domain